VGTLLPKVGPFLYGPKPALLKLGSLTPYSEVTAAVRRDSGAFALGLAALGLAALGLALAFMALRACCEHQGRAVVGLHCWSRRDWSDCGLWPDHHGCASSLQSLDRSYCTRKASAAVHLLPLLPTSRSAQA
jgi:hypothetical protein